MPWPLRNFIHCLTAKCGELSGTCLPGIVQLLAVSEPAQTDWIHLAIQPDIALRILQGRCRPALALTLGTTEEQITTTVSHAVEIDGVGYDSGSGLDLAELNLVGEGPVSNRLVHSLTG